MEFKKYSWDDFFEFNDTTPLNQFESQISRIETLYEGMLKTIVSANNRVVDSQQELIEQAKNVLKTVEASNMAQSNSADVMNKSATSAHDLTTEMKSLRDSEAANAKQIADLEKQIAQLTATKEKAKKATQGEAGSLKDLEKQLSESIASYKALGESTDDSVKEEHLKRIRELAAQHKTASGALNDAKKASVNAAGSYNELSARVAAAKKELKEMGGAFDGTNPKIKQLQKEIEEGSDKLKGFDAAVGDNQRNVGNYKSALEGVIPGLSGVTSGIESATAAGKAFIATPIGLILAAVAAAVALVATYFQRTDEGGDKLAEILTVISEVLGVILDVAAQAGKVIFDAISEPSKIWEAFVGILGDAKDALIAFATEPMKYIKQLGDFIVTNIINRFKAFEVLYAAIQKIVDGDFGEGFKKLADGFIQLGTGVTDATDKIAAGLDKMFGGLADSISRAVQLAREIAALEDEADAKRIENIKFRARVELEQTELIKKSKDKLRVSDEERFRAVKREGELSKQLLNAELDVANKLLAVAQKRIEIRKLEGDVTDDLKEAEANALKEVLGLQARSISEAAARQKREIALVKEVEAELLATIKRERDARVALDKFIIEDRIRLNNRIIADEEAALDEVLKAIVDNSDDQQRILEQTREQQLAIARETAIARIELSDDELSTIYNNESLSLKERIEQERAIKEQRLNEDKAFVDERTKIESEYFAKIDELNKATADNAERNVFRILARDAERLKDSTDTLIAEGLIDLNAEFEAGEIKAEEYQRRRAEIQENGQRVQLENQIDFLEEQRKLFEQSGKDTTDLERQIAEARVTLSDQTANAILAREQQLQQALGDLRNQSIETATSIVQSSFEAEQIRLDERMANLQERAALELELAGNNEAAKAEIQNKFALEQAKIEDEKAKVARRAAVFEKVSAVFTIGVNTAIAVSKAIAAAPLTGGLPFSAIAAALGALQIAAVLAKPIPAYEDGTLFHPGGLALFGEAGPEWVQHSSGGPLTYVDRPTIAELPRGAKVFNEEMMAANAMMERSVGNYSTDNERLGSNDDARVADQRVFQMLNDRMESLEQTIAGKREVHVNLTKKGIQTLVKMNDDWNEYFNQNVF